jgi:hypothetical protein
MVIQSVVVASPKSTPVRLSVTALLPGRRVPAQSEEPPLDEPVPLLPLDEPLDEPKPLPPLDDPDELLVPPLPFGAPEPDPEVLPKLLPLLDEAPPWEHAL